MPAASCSATSARSACSSTRSLRNGVTSAVNAPSNMALTSPGPSHGPPLRVEQRAPPRARTRREPAASIEPLDETVDQVAGLLDRFSREIPEEVAHLGEHRVEAGLVSGFEDLGQIGRGLAEHGHHLASLG